MSAISATLYGQKLTGITIPAGTPIDWTLTCQDRTGLAPIDLTSAYVAMTLSPIDSANGAILAHVISDFATISSPGSAGICTVSWSASDTRLATASYFLAIWITDAFGNRISILGWSYIDITAGGSPTPPDPSLPPNGLPIYFRGLYVNTTAYQPLDSVSYVIGGITSTYVCIAQTTGHDPTNATYWTIAASGATQGTETANTFYRGPTSGSPAFPTFGPIVAADLPATAVTPGSYTSANITVGTDGRITAASSGAGGGVSSLTGSQGVSVSASTGAITLSLDLSYAPTWTGTHTFNAGPVIASAAATSGTTTRNSPALTLRGAYWNGSASVSDDVTLTNVVGATTPTNYLEFGVGGASVYRLHSSGGFSMPDGSAAAVSGSGRGSLHYDNTMKAFAASCDTAAYQYVLTNNWRTVPAGVVLFPATPAAVSTVGYIAALVAGKGATGDSTHDGARGGEADLASGDGGDAIGSRNPGGGENLYINTGSGGVGGTGNSSAGTMYLDSGQAHGTGLTGVINIGLTYARSISLVGGAVTLAPRSGGVVTITAAATSVWGTSTGNLTVQANAGGATLSLSAPTGTINIGATSATAINIGNTASPSTTTFAGTLAFPTGGIAGTALANTAVSAGSYTVASITVDAQGRITAASNGSAGSGTVTSVAAGTGLSGGTITTTGTISMPNTGPGATTTGGGGNYILSITTDAQGRITALTTGAPAGAGTVTSVATSGGITGGTITGSGTLSLDLTYAANFTAAHTHTITAIGATVGTAGMTLINTTAALSGAQNQYSPALILQGTAWNASATKTVAWAIQAFGTNVATPVPTLNFANNIDGAGWTTQWKIGATSITQATVGTSITMTNGLTYQATSTTANHLFNSTQAPSTAGSYVARFVDSGSIGLYIGMVSGTAGVPCYGEDLTATGTVTAGEIVVWAGSDGKTVATAAATNNLTTIAGVAVTTATNAAVRIARRGRCAVNADASITVGQLVGSSSGTAGNAQSGTTPGSGAVLGRACSATASSKITVDICLA